MTHLNEVRHDSGVAVTHLHEMPSLAATVARHANKGRVCAERPNEKCRITPSLHAIARRRRPPQRELVALRRQFILVPVRHNVPDSDTLMKRLRGFVRFLLNQRSVFSA